jgi:Domain of unknown function (DUF4395)
MASRLAHWMRCNLSMQGYESLGDDERRELGLGLRLSPVLCLTGMTLGVVLESPAILLGMAGTAVLGGFVTAKHPFDPIWDQGLRRLSGGPPLPRTPAPRRFACQIASVWLAALAGAISEAPTRSGWFSASRCFWSPPSSQRPIGACRRSCTASSVGGSVAASLGRAEP